MTSIKKLIVREQDLKSELKELREHIKAAIEGTPQYKTVYEAAVEVRDVEVNQKTAKAHAFKVVYDSFKPKDEEN